jgi:ABC-2 type transport system ATP-binding protein
MKSGGKTVILTTHYLDEAEQLSDKVAIMNQGHIVAMGSADEIIEEHGSGERLEVHGSEKLADYVRANTNLKVNFDSRGLTSIDLNQKRDALIALEAIDKSGLDWGELHTRRDSLDDVFVKLVRGEMDAQGEIRAKSNSGNSIDKRRR